MLFVEMAETGVVGALCFWVFPQALPANMSDSYLGIEVDPPSVSSHPQTPIIVLEVHKEVFVKQPDLLHRFSPDY